MAAKTILITGATSGIGTQTALALAKLGHTLYLLVRNTDKGNRVKNDIIAETQNQNIYVVECDLTGLKNVSKAAAEIKAQVNSIDVLINNAGGIFPARQLSTDGFEMTFALNHLGHFLLTMKLMPLLQKGKARIINVSSDAHKAAKVDFDDLQFEKAYSSMKAYGNAKLFNIYFTRSLAERYANTHVTAYALHPGVVNTGFGSQSTGFIKFLLSIARPFMITPEKGAQTSVFLATEPGIEPLSGQYFKNKKPIGPSSAANNNVARQALWLKSEELADKYLL
jgi:NAD(P)-dependent dehydrogenase (short-subunit alcohol dehydrogenase family)